MRLLMDFFNRSAVVVASDLLGKVLVHGDKRGAILETEAYLADGDEASHVFQKRMKALEAFAYGPGTVYIHPMRGYVGVDLVVADGSVLLRALNLPGADGPGKMTREMGITSTLHGANVTDPGSPIWVAYVPPSGSILTGPRVRISKNANAPYRFRLKDGLPRHE